MFAQSEGGWIFPEATVELIAESEYQCVYNKAHNVINQPLHVVKVIKIYIPAIVLSQTSSSTIAEKASPIQGKISLSFGVKTVSISHTSLDEL